MICVIEKTEDGYAAFIDGVPDCVRRGPTVDEVTRRIREAVCLYFQSHPSAIPLTFRSSTDWYSIESSWPIAVLP